MTGAVRWLADYEENGEVCFRVGTNGPEVIAEWIGLATFVARRDGSNPVLTFASDVDPRDAEKIRRGSAWLLQRQLERRLGMHGSAVVVDGQAVVFLGRSGAGKSTFAAAMCLRGAALLADDAVGIEPSTDGEGWSIVPREVDHWLDPSSIAALGGRAASTAKEPRPATRPAQAPARLAMFVELAFGDREPALERLRGIQAVGCLVPQVARFILDEPERQRHELDLLHSMVEKLPIFRLDRPKQFEKLPASVQLVLELLGPRGTKV